MLSKVDLTLPIVGQPFFVVPIQQARDLAEIVQMLTASGTADEAREAVAGYMANGCTSPVLYPLGDVYATIDAFAGWDSNS